MPTYRLLLCLLPSLLSSLAYGAPPLLAYTQAPPRRPEREAKAAAAPRPHAFTFEDMIHLKRVSDPQVSPDGTRLCFVVSTPDPESNKTSSALFLGTISGTPGPVRQLTFPRGPAGTDPASDSSPRFSPDGKRLAFVSTRAGTPQVYLLDLSGGEAQRLTDLPGGASDPLWAPDGQSLIVQSGIFPECPPFPEGEECNRRRNEAQEHGPIKARVIERLFYRHWDTWFDGRRTHLLRVPLPPQKGRPVDLTPGRGDVPPLAHAGAAPYGISPDGKELALVENLDRDQAVSTNNDVLVLSLSASSAGAGRRVAPRNLTGDNHGTDNGPRYSPDGRYLAYLSQRRPGFEADRAVLWLYDRQTGRRRPLTDGLDASVSEAVFARDSRRIYFTTSLLGRGRLYAVDLSGTPPAELLTADASDLQVAPALPGRGEDAALVFISSSFSRAAEVVRLSLSRDGRPLGPPMPLTGVNDEVWPALQMGQVSELWGQTRDGRRLHSFLVTPAGFDRSKRYPAVVLIHGGPQGAWEDLWHWRWNPQIYAGAGYVVLMVNPRGSEGYGQRFEDEVSGDWGGKAYDDVMRAVDQLAALPYVDARRMAAMGASYGGYMVNWIAGHTDRFAALVSHDGVYDLRSMQGETEELWFPRWEFGGDPWNSEQYEKWNPAHFAGHFKTPMLVITSEKDYRVPVGQGMQLFTALQLRHVPSKMLLFPDENHWVLHPGNARLWHASVLDWLHHYLGGAPADAKALQSAACYCR